MKKFLLLFSLTIFAIQAHSQIGMGIVFGNDIYQRYTNPDEGVSSRSSGNAILNAHIGPKVWIGGENFSLSLETYANWGSTSLSLSDYKGMGAFAFPCIAKLNFNGNSGFNSELMQGWSIGGGYQVAKTEIYGISYAAAENGVNRQYFPVYVAELSYGYGIGGVVIELFGRYGFNPDNEASTFNFGLSYNFNANGIFKLVRKFERFGEY